MAGIAEFAATDGYRAAPIGRGRSTYNAPFCATISKLMASLKPIGQSTFVLPAEKMFSSVLPHCRYHCSSRILYLSEHSIDRQFLPGEGRDYERKVAHNATG